MCLAVIGANGAGKYTAVNVLVGMQQFGLHPEDRRPSPCVRGSARLHHLELHMQETPTLYILWRFAGNDDKESIVFMSDNLSVDEEFVRSVKWRIAGAIGSVCPCTDPKGAE